MMVSTDDLNPDFIECRDLQHAWRYFNVIHRKEEKLYDEVLRCLRCDTLKHRFISYDGEYVKSPRYEYPEGYVVKGQGRASADDRAKIRIAAMNRSRTRKRNK